MIFNYASLFFAMARGVTDIGTYNHKEDGSYNKMIRDILNPYDPTSLRAWNKFRTPVYKGLFERRNYEQNN